MELVILKNRIKKTKNIFKIISSLKLMCLTRIKQLKIVKNNLINNIYNMENNILNNIKKSVNNKEEIINSKTINIILFTDMSFCGNFNENNKNILEKLNSKSNNWIVGIKGKKYTNNEDKIYITKLYDKNLITFIINKINNMSKEYEYMEINIYSYNNQVINIKLTNNYYEDFYHKYLIKKIITEFKYEECHLRFIKINTAIKNTEELQKNLEILYNKKRQEIITKDLLETISGSQI